MKLFRYGAVGAEKTGVVLDGKHIDTSAFGEDYNEAFFATNGLERLKVFVQNNASNLIEIQIDNERLGSCVARPSKIVCIGLNYRDHAEESNMAIPKEPVVFMKSTTSLCGPNDDLIIPRGSLKTDWEVELGVVIGKKASYITEAEAMSHVAGYCVINDYSERVYQLEKSGQWDLGKGSDTFAPVGPYLVSADEVADVNNLRLWLNVNGKKMQDGNTKNLIFNVAHIISYLSNYMTLLPGDIISTGTPAGVGLGQKPNPVYLKVGDVCELGIDGLGSQKQTATQKL